MRSFVLAIAALVMLATGAATAQAGYPQNRFDYHNGRQYYSRVYGPYQDHYRYRYGGYDDPHSAAVRRIQAYHSRYRYNPHPRSPHKSPPSPYDYWGW